ncbi:hypothetical protein SBA3_1260037 [Candidatus Sulfopaludibacter sp. SbA3]|nr:hypothetical protein SBA3_1260037 [Candidatus Sulfopaludibacter sp. SbA3]
MKMAGGERIGISRRGKFEPGTKIHGFAADTRLGSFEGGKDLRRTHGTGFSMSVRICGGYTFRDFRGRHGLAAYAPPRGFGGGRPGRRSLTRPHENPRAW